jgi:hypothetical protein
LNESPAIQLFHAPVAAPDLIAAFLIGCEEEGVPVVTASMNGEAGELARHAANASALFIGAGIDASGTMALHEQRLAARPLLFEHRSASLADARRLGCAAGRLARGRPLPGVTP